VYPDDRAAITVFTNIYPGGSAASGQLAGRIANIIFASADTVDAAAGVLARKVYDGLAQGMIDRNLLTPNADAFFSQQVVADYAAGLGPLGAPTEFTAGGSSLRGGLRIRSFRIRAGNVNLGLTMMVRPDGRIEQYIVERDS
jgi:hypothetical protein